MRNLYLHGLDAYLSYHDLPGREPVRVFLPGLGGTASALFAHIATHEGLVGHRTLLVDFLGFGHSDRPSHFGYTLAEQAETVVTLLEDLRVEQCEVIGHSAGGTIAVHVAAQRPDLVATLVLSEANLDPDPGPGAFSSAIAAQTEAEFVADGFDTLISSRRQRARASKDGWISALLAGVNQLSAPFALHRSARALVEMPAPTARELLTGLSLPRRYLVGTRALATGSPTGDLADWPYGAGLREAGVELIVVPEVGHLMMWENPNAYAGALRDALDRSHH